MKTSPTHDQLWRVQLAQGMLDTIRALADGLEFVDGLNIRDAPANCDVLIDSSGVTGWMVAVDRWDIRGRSDDLAALCRSLVAVGRKREREIAGRIKVRALKQGAPAHDWAGEPPKPNVNVPRSIVDVAAAWKAGKAMQAGNVSTDGRSLYSWRLRIGRTCGDEKIVADYRQRVSMSTSRHVAAAVEFADRVEQPHHE